MEVSWLEDFLTLSVTRNFTRAAELRNVTQPAFSRRIRNLEYWVGAVLIDRSLFPISLTPAGEAFARPHRAPSMRCAVAAKRRRD